MADARISNYEIVLPFQGDDKKVLAVNGLYGAFDIVTGEDAGNLQLALKDCSCLKCLSEDCFARLSERGHIVMESEEAELENFRLLSECYIRKNAGNVYNPVIVPGSGCNFRCKYCFERNTDGQAGQFNPPAMMTVNLARRVFDRLEQYQKKGGRIGDCTIYGGEPLMEPNRKVLEITAESCRKLGIRADCVTNGYFLDQFIEMLAREPFRTVQITVDGPRDIHDSRRAPADGSGSFDRIMENIGLALKRGICIQVRININRENLQPAMKLPEEFQSRGFTDWPGFSFYYRTTEARHESDQQSAVTEQELFTALQDKFGKKDAMQLSNEYRTLAERLRRGFESGDPMELTPFSCGAEGSMIVIDPDGQLHTCWEMTGKQEKVGSVDPVSGEFRFGREYYYWRTRSVGHMEFCNTCPYAMFCGGGCAAAALEETGRLFAGVCGERREIFNSVALTVCTEQFEKSGTQSFGRSNYGFCRENRCS